MKKRSNKHFVTVSTEKIGNDIKMTIKPVKKQLEKPKDWRYLKKIVSRYCCSDDEGCTIPFEEITNYISKMLSRQREEIREKIQELKGTKNMIEVCDQYSDDSDTKIHFDDGYQWALADVLSLLGEDGREEK